MRFAILIAGLVFCAGGAVAAPGLETAIGACAAKTDAAARLACYDAIAAHVKPASVAPAAAEPAAAPAPAPVQAAQNKTPAAAPTAADFGSEFIEQKQKEEEAADRPDGPDEIHAKVIAIAFAANGRFTVTLDNGQVWRQVQGAGERSLVAKLNGTGVTIAHGFWKSYNLVFDAGGDSFKVVRDK